MGEVSDNTDDDPSYYEFKFRIPNNVIVDSTHNSWTGAIEEPSINDAGSNLIFGVIYF